MSMTLRGSGGSDARFHDMAGAPKMIARGQPYRLNAGSTDASTSTFTRFPSLYDLRSTSTLLKSRQSSIDAGDHDTCRYETRYKASQT